ncbi:UDP-3-O-[3-hydroxymyristoyl] glucosamine N-acyltransferase [hydrothermal vent metagenome]|uniref:UDP-3-O-[3-hydroxymyristoyl] glucosamine N-acyltransferase n=1 Tax=hydrothermal vent metagenome TaxID=652676 RepID=A0A3B1AL64_9ZZZZ
MAVTLLELSKVVNGEVVGDDSCVINSVATLSSALEGQISFLSNNKFKNELANTKASAIILKTVDPENYMGNCIIVQDPLVAYAKIAAILHPLPESTGEFHESAVIHPSAKIADNCTIGANCVIAENANIAQNTIIESGCYIGRDCVIGEDSRIYPNVVIKHGSLIGNRCIIDSGTVIGSDGFGNANENGHWVKIPQIGIVIVGNDVQIGSNVVIDRGAIENTVIHDGVVMDNLIHVAHNVSIGENSAVAGCVGIAGSTVIGKNCMFAGQVGISGHIKIADNVTLTGASNAFQSIKEAGVYSSGTPLEPFRQWQKSNFRFKKLDDMARKIKDLEKMIKELK